MFHCSMRNDHFNSALRLKVCKSVKQPWPCYTSFVINNKIFLDTINCDSNIIGNYKGEKLIFISIFWKVMACSYQESFHFLLDFFVTLCAPLNLFRAALTHQSVAAWNEDHVAVLRHAFHTDELSLQFFILLGNLIWVWKWNIWMWMILERNVMFLLDICIHYLKAFSLDMHLFALCIQCNLIWIVKKFLDTHNLLNIHRLGH